MRRYRNIHRAGQIHAAKYDARINGRRAQRQLDALAAVQTHANGSGHGFESALFKHGAIVKAIDMAGVCKGFSNLAALLGLPQQPQPIWPGATKRTNPRG